MKVFVFNIKGALGSFQRPQSNNNPSTFYVMPKSAVIGLICGNIGIDRDVMKETNMYSVLTEKLQYSIKLNKPFKIKYWSEYAYKHNNLLQADSRPKYTPNKSERLTDVDYDIYLLYDETDHDINGLINNFIKNIKEGTHVFPPYLGMANMHADLCFIGLFDTNQQNGIFETSGICTNLVMEEDIPFENIRTDNIPTRSKAFLSHDSNSYVDVYFHDNCGSLKGEGNYYQVGEEAVEFI